MGTRTTYQATRDAGHHSAGYLIAGPGTVNSKTGQSMTPLTLTRTESIMAAKALVLAVLLCVCKCSNLRVTSVRTECIRVPGK